MQVAMVHGRADPAHDGVADYTRHLVAALRRHGVDVTTVPVDPGPAGAVRAAQRVRAAVRPDVVHVQFAPSAFGFSGVPGLVVPALAGRPLVTTVHEYGGWSWAPRVPDAVWRRLEPGLDRETGRLVPASDVVLATNAEHERVLRERLGVVPERAPLPPNVPVVAGVDRAAVRAREGIAPDAEVVVFFGFVHPVKGLRYLVDAVATLAAERPGLHLLIVGGFTSLALPRVEADAFRAELTAHVERAGAGDRVTVTGHRPADEVSALLTAADVAAFPFTAGATLKSGALLAALEHGLPTVVTRRPDAESDPDLVDSETVVVAPAVRDVDVLVTALRRILDDPGEAERVAGNGRALVEGRDWDTLAARHAAIYRELA